MDKALIRRRFSKAVGSYTRQADVQRKIAVRLSGLVDRYVPVSSRKKVLEVGCGTGLFTRHFLLESHPEQLLLNDICSEMKSCFTDILGKNIRFEAGDAESLAFPGGQDLIVSCSAIQWFEYPERFLNGCRSLLNKDGFLAISTFGPENVREITSLTDSALPYRSLQKLRSGLEKEYQVVYAKEELVDMSFSSPMEVLRHLKETGVTGIRDFRWTKRTLSDFCRRYEERYTKPDGNVSLTYHPIYIICRK